MMKRPTSGFDNSESDVNFTFTWAFQVSMIWDELNAISEACELGVNLLDAYRAKLIKLIYHLGHDIDLKYEVSSEKGSMEKGDKYDIEGMLDDVTKKLRNYNLFINKSQMLRRQRHDSILKDLHQIRTCLDYQMTVRGIKHKLKMDLKEQARRQWYGDAT